MTRHFVRHFLDLGFASAAGEEGVRRVLLGLMSAVVALGLFLPRVLMGKYVAVMGNPEAFRDAVLGDTLMTFALAMLAAAFAAALAGDAMFPDETDFRVLTPLPVTRAFVFAAKLRAVAIYLGLVIVVVSLALQLPFTLVTSGRHAEHPWVVRVSIHAAVSIGAALFAALAVMSTQGVIVLCAPGRYLRSMTVGARTAMLCGVVLLLPLAGRLPGQSGRFADRSALLWALPPAWFTGLQRLALGSGDHQYSMAMAALALTSLAGAAAIVAGCYVALYRRFDIVVLRGALPGSLGRRTRARAFSRDPLTTVVERFARRTLWRSPLHQMVFLGVSACGAGWVLNSLLAAGLGGWFRGSGATPPRLVDAVLTMPFVLMLAAVTGLRFALMLPQDPHANWIFRMTDEDGHRQRQLDAVERLFVRLAVIPALACALPLQFAVLGGEALIAGITAWLWGTFLVELTIRTWRRIPFTCSYIPGKRAVAESVVIALTVFAFFTTIGTTLVRYGRWHPSRFLIVCGVLIAAIGVARRVRLKSWGRAPLMFDDDPADFAPPLQLS